MRLGRACSILLYALVCSLSSPACPALGQVAADPPGRLAAQADQSCSVASEPAALPYDPEGGEIPICRTVHGRIDDESDADVYRFRGLAGESVRIAVDSSYGNLDPAVSVFLDATRLYPAIASAAALGAAPAFDGETAAIAPTQGSGTPGIFVEIESPLDGSVVPIPAGQANIPVSGRAWLAGASLNLEVAIVIDISGSMSDDEFELEAAGVRAILTALDPDNDGWLSSPVAMVQFSSTGQITAPMTRSRSQLEAGLLRKGEGGTNFDRAFDAASTALAPSSPSDDVTELVLFFSDGNPEDAYTPPGQGGPVDQLVANGVRVDTFGIGSEALPGPLQQIARASGGTYTAIPTFGAIPRVTASLPAIVGLQSVAIDVNQDTIGDIVANVAVDGTFTANLPIGVGRNVLTAIATATDPQIGVATDTVTVIGQRATRVGNSIQIVHDDNSGPGRNALIEVLRLPFTGQYTILVASSGQGSSGSYQLRLSPVDRNSNTVAVARGDSTSFYHTTDGLHLVTLDGALAGYSPNGSAAAVERTVGDTPYVDVVRLSDGHVIATTTGEVLTFSPDGAWVAIDNGNRSYVSVYDTESGRQVVGAGGEFVAFAPNGELMAVADGAYTHFYRMREGRAVISAPNELLGFSMAGDTVATGVPPGSPGASVSITAASDGRQVLGTGGEFVGYSPDGRAVAVARGDHTYIHSTQDGRQLHAQLGTFIDFSPDALAASISSGSAVFLVSLWDPHLRVERTAEGMVFAPDAEVAALTSAGRVEFVNLAEGRSLPAPVSSLAAIGPDGEAAVLSQRIGNTTHLDLLNLRDGRTGTKTVGEFLGYSPDGWRVAVDTGGGVGVYESRRGQPYFNLSGQWAGFSPNGKFAAASDGGYTHYYRTADGRCVLSQPGGLLSYGPDSMTVITGSPDSFSLYRIADARQLLGAGGEFLAYSVDSQIIAVRSGTSGQQWVSLYSTDDGEQVCGRDSLFVAFGPDSDTAALTERGSLALYSTRDGRRIMAPSGSLAGYSFDRTPASMVRGPYKRYIPVAYGLPGGEPEPTPVPSATPTATETVWPTFEPTPTPATPGPRPSPRPTQPPPPGSGISGRVTDDDWPAIWVDLSLIRSDGSATQVIANTTTDGSGIYSFTGIGDLPSGTVYNVRYGPNIDDNSRLAFWYGPDIAAYRRGQQVSGGDFDIADVALESPSPGASVGFPATFTWQRRGLSGDSYQWVALDRDADRRWATRDLGDVGSVTIDSLPSGMSYGKEYWWYVRVFHGPDSFGVSHYMRKVVFVPQAGGISGRVTCRGVPAPGLALELRWYDGSEWSTVAETTTDSEGRYSFTGVPSLQVDQGYYVRYGPQTSEPSHVWTWFGPTLESYTAGDSASGGDFDVGGVSLLSPPNGASVRIPATFIWQRRGIPEDVYRWYIEDPVSLDTWRGNDTPGDRTTLTALMPGASYHRPYQWYLRVYSGDSGHGITFVRRVTFVP